MNGINLINDQNQTAQLAAQFNQFYLKTTSTKISQIGNYRIIEEIGEGSFGKVYLARHILLNINVVLKCGLIDDPNIVREIYYHKQLKHKNIVSLYEVIKTESHLWIAMEYCEGGELYYYIYDKKSLTLAECQTIFFQIVLGVKYVHSLNLSHRDLKLENILLADKKRTVVKLTDFGFIREFNPYSRRFLSTICGTTVYMAPELLKNEKYSGFSVDIWSLGVILYTMLYGVLPFDDDDELKTRAMIISGEPQYTDRIPEEANQLIKKMLSKDPAKRPNLIEILNSELLIDSHNKYLAEINKRSYSSSGGGGDTESIISINQHYNTIKEPFESKIERDILKKLRRLNFDTEELQACVLNKEMNSLTAFYELLLTQEYSKKKQKYMREKKRKYYETTLRKSRKRVKSVLALTEQVPTQPLDRIISTLSLVSNRSKTNLAKVTDPRKSIELDKSRRSMDLDRRMDPPSPKTTSTSLSLPTTPSTSTPLRHQLNSTAQPLFSLAESPKTGSKPVSSHSGKDTGTLSLDSTVVDAPSSMRRSVSFVPEERRLSTISTKESLKPSRSQTSQTSHQSKGGKILTKLRFWKKHKNEINGNQEKQSGSNGSIQSIEMRSKNPSPEPRDEMTHERKPSISVLDTESPLSPPLVIDTNMDYSKPDNRQVGFSGQIVPKTPPSIEPRGLTRTRPSSMISQTSQISRLSQMSAMLSESELDILDETDTMDDDFDDEDDAYESSLNDTARLSSVDMTPSSSLVINKPVQSSSTGGQHKNRPGYRRATSSDLSVQTTSTNSAVGVSPLPLTKRKSMPVLQHSLEDLSSERSTSLEAPAPVSYTDPIVLVPIHRPISPDLAKKRRLRLNPATSGTNNINNQQIPQHPAFVRSPSPPLGFKINTKTARDKVPIGKRNPATQSFFQNSVFPKGYQETKQVEDWIHNSNFHATVKQPTYEPVIDEEEEIDDV
ncbi:putative serine/threonine-protein kinase [Spathaspora sp. JA1]|nr:putative serine/threonine-protein kinase [Spathaspora sp. JA1]